MGVPSLKNRVGMTVSGTPGTGTITLSSAEPGYQSFASAYGANANVDVLIVDGSAWEVARDCTYTHSGTTLSRGTLEASSTGSALSLTSAAKVYVTNSADRINIHNTVSNAALRGYNLEWLAATGSIIRAKPGYVSINGKWFTDTGYITTITGDTSLVADSIYNVYLYDDNGTRKLEIDRRTSATDDPEYDAALDYHTAPNTAQFTTIGQDNYRWIGYFYTWSNSGTAECETFVCSGRGREKTFSQRFKSITMHRFATGTAATWTAVDISAVKPVPATHIYLSGYAQATSAGELVVGMSTFALSGSTTTEGNYLFRAYTPASGFSMGPSVAVPIDGASVYWLTQAASGSYNSAYVQQLGSICVC